MPYGRTNYEFVVDSSFRPYSFGELIQPFAIYKDAYEKQEAAMEELANKDILKYLGNLPEGSKSREIYDGYMNDFNKYSADFSKRGLNMQNRRALQGLKKRYASEIGRLEAANTAMQEERKLRRANKDLSMLYAEDNLNIDQFLDGNNPNLYGVSGDDLRKEAAQYAQAASSRIYGNTQVQDITKYFQEIMQTQGYSPEAMAAFRQNLESIPEFNQAVQDIMDAHGVSGNLKGANLERARQNIINGIMEGALYKEARNVQQNPGVLTKEQEARNALGWANHNESVRQHNLQMKIKGYDEQGNYHPENDQELRKAAEIAKRQGKVDDNGNPTKRSSQKSSSKKLKEARSYDGKGNVSPITKSQTTKYGKQISYAEALQIDPSIATHDPGNEDSYEYFQNGNTVSVVPNPRENGQQQKNSEEVITDNQL